MITSIFSKSKPINFLIVFFISLLALFTAVYKLDDTQLTMIYGIKLSASFLCFYFSVLVLDFIVGKNHLSLKSNFEILLFSLFLLAVPQIVLNHNVVISNFLILLALRRIVSMRTSKNVKNKLFDAALLIGFASLFYFWSILFFALIFAALLFYYENHIKNWLIPFFGLIAVFVLTVCYSILFNDDFFSALNLQPQVSFDYSGYNSIQFIVAITMLLSFGIWSSVFYLRSINAKKKTTRSSYKVVFVAAIIGSVIAILSPIKQGSEFLFLFAPFAIVITNYIESIQERWFREVFLVAMIVIPFLLLVL